MSTTRTTEPTQITQGERIAWTKSYADYSAEDYDLVYRFRHATKPGFNVTATADGADFDAVITVAVSEDAAAGAWRWQAWLTEQADSTNTFCVGEGRATVVRGFSSSSTAAVDTRTDAKVALDAINAAISSKATADQLEYEISTPAGSRRVKRMSMTELLAAQKHFASIVNNELARERARNGGPLGQRIGIRVYDE